MQPLPSSAVLDQSSAITAKTLADLSRQRAFMGLEETPELLDDAEPELVAEGSLQSRRNSGEGKTLVRYRWDDPHTVIIKRWTGDKSLIDPRSRREELALTAEIDRDRMKQAMASFGVPSSWYGLRASNRAELDEKVRVRNQSAAARGILINNNTNRIDHKWVVEHSRTDVRDLVLILSKKFKDRGYRTQREFLGVVASFVQSMAYKIPASDRLTRSGTMIRTGGVTMPIETLYRGYGDCDTKSLLFASILANFPSQRIIFLMGDKHLFVGVRDIPRHNEHYVKIRGTKYILIELTKPWPIGRIPQKAWVNCGRNVYRTAVVVNTAAARS